jgi:hypothetical protein
MTDKSKLIAQQNDQFRKNFGSQISDDQEIKGKYCVTQGISELPLPEQFLITLKIREFDDFNENNDPYGEHDYGKFKHNADDIMWKIDYYDENYEYGSEDPSDLSKTRRVLTAMMAHEY